MGDMPAEWHVVNTLSPLVNHSPHHRYHAAILQISTLDLMWGSASFTPAAKRQMARDVLSLWQSGQGYGPVSDYLDLVEAVWSKRLENHAPIDSKDLPTGKSVAERRASTRPTTGTRGQNAVRQ
jgi:hypothetical protein